MDKSIEDKLRQYLTLLGDIPDILIEMDRVILQNQTYLYDEWYLKPNSQHIVKNFPPVKSVIRAYNDLVHDNYQMFLKQIETVLQIYELINLPPMELSQFKTVRSVRRWYRDYVPLRYTVKELEAINSRLLRYHMTDRDFCNKIFITEAETHNMYLQIDHDIRAVLGLIGIKDPIEEDLAIAKKVVKSLDKKKKKKKKPEEPATTTEEK